MFISSWIVVTRQQYHFICNPIWEGTKKGDRDRLKKKAKIYVLRSFYSGMQFLVKPL